LDTEITLVPLLIDPMLRENLRAHMSISMWDTDIGKTAYNVLMAEEFKNKNRIDESVIRVKLTERGLSSDIVDRLLVYMRSVPQVITPLKYESYISTFEVFMRRKLLGLSIQRANTIGVDQAVVGIRKACEFTLRRDKAYDFSNSEDVQKIIDNSKQAGQVVRSSFMTINNSILYGGFKPGYVVMYVAAPGVGKTTLMINEGIAALAQGRKVLHIFLGDMEDDDVLIRYTACINRVTVNDVAANPSIFLTDNVKKLFSNLRVLVYSSYEVDVNELSAIIQRKKTEGFDFNLCIIDYDGNIRPSHDDMYKEGGYTYATIKKTGSEFNYTTYIACQSKVIYWGHEVVPLEAPSESSKKQHAIDALITFGIPAKGCPYGTLHLAKVRRGLEGVIVRVRRLYSNAMVFEVDEEEYKNGVDDYKSSQVCSVNFFYKGDKKKKETNNG
jgi:hypothetical protein